MSAGAPQSQQGGTTIPVFPSVKARRAPLPQSQLPSWARLPSPPPHTHPTAAAPVPGAGPGFPLQALQPGAWRLPCQSGLAQTPLYIVGLFNVISKECSAACQASYQDFTVGKQNVSCCSTDLCNLSGAGSVGSSYATLAAGLTASVLCALLRNGL
uniref:Snake toxin/toxin-like domain-containing protein n=1 Tax=Chelydra serpentina TaxID=8475 RepID=A0A8C3XST4_CHESE